MRTRTRGNNKSSEHQSQSIEIKSDRQLRMEKREQLKTPEKSAVSEMIDINKISAEKKPYYTL